MSFELEQFVSNPSLEEFDKCTKAELLLIAEHYQVDLQHVTKKAIKQEILTFLILKNIYPVAKVGGEAADLQVQLEIQRRLVNRLSLTEVRLRESELKERAG